MGFDDDLLRQAQSGDRDAAEMLLASMYPAIYRMAAGLSGREDVGRGIVRFVMTRAARQMARWRDADEAQRWFYHHTVLTWRRASQHRPDARSDVLNAGAADPSYTAFLMALRGLPQQQLEAFVLNRGEHLNVRYLAVAMDCSTHAAELHLSVATERLEAMAGPDFEAMTQRMGRAYESLSPEEEFFRPGLRAIVRAPRWPVVLRQVVVGVVIAGILAAAGWLGLRIVANWGR